MFPLERMTSLVLARKCLAVEQAINRGCINVLHLVAELTVLADPSCATDVGVELEAELWGVKALIVLGQYEKALNAAGEIFDRCAKVGLQEKAAEMLLVHARIFMESGSLVGFIAH